MAIKKTIERGLWSMTKTIFDADDDYDDDFEVIIPPERELALSRLEGMRAEAIAVLAAAGFPTEPGRYIRLGNKRYEQVEGPFRRPGYHVIWPSFKEIEDLSIEYFAAQVLREINFVNRSLQDGVDGHKLAERMMTLMDAYYPFRVERDSIGKAAEVGNKAKRSISAAQDARRNNATDTRSPVEQFVEKEAKEIREKHPIWKPYRVATEITRRAKDPNRAQCIETSFSTIRRILARLDCSD